MGWVLIWSYRSDGEPVGSSRVTTSFEVVGELEVEFEPEYSSALDMYESVQERHPSLYINGGVSPHFGYRVLGVFRHGMTETFWGLGMERPKGEESSTVRPFQGCHRSRRGAGDHQQAAHKPRVCRRGTGRPRPHAREVQYWK